VPFSRLAAKAHTLFDVVVETRALLAEVPWKLTGTGWQTENLLCGVDHLPYREGRHIRTKELAAVVHLKFGGNPWVFFF
jgi:hypothetical protein